LDLFDYIPQNQSLMTAKDKTFDKIISNWDVFINCLDDDDDKQLVLKIISKCYFKYQDSIKANTNSDFELNTRILMSILIEQQKQIDKLIE
jgi:hypothetical protein